MTANTMSNLEKNAETHRAGLADAIGDFTEALAPDRLGRQAIDDVAQAGRNATQAVAQAAKDNPVGLALIGVGAALVLAGSAAKASNAGGTSAPSMAGQDARIARADAKMTARRAVAIDRRPGPSASTMRKMLDKGLDKLGPEARDRVIALRLKAIDAQDAAERQARKAIKTAKGTHESNPYVTGLAAAGLGGLIGALLPSTRKEAELMGAKRDELLRAAETRLKQEIADLETKGKAAVDDAVKAGATALRSQAG